MEDWYTDRELQALGVKLIAPGKVLVSKSVPAENIEAGCEIFPWTRISGARTVISRNAKIGTHGPVTATDCAIGDSAVLGSGWFESSVFLKGTTLGSEASVRPGCIFEEGSSTGHATGTKSTIVYPFAAIGSNVNLCNCVLSGGTSKANHSEVGSGFIHLNFTPFGPEGDKATSSSFGSPIEGLFLNSPRVFLGGDASVVGPATLGHGSTLVAGSVHRGLGIDPAKVYFGATTTRQPVERNLEQETDPKSIERAKQQITYARQLVAIAAWYRWVRSHWATSHTEKQTVSFAIDLLVSGAKSAVTEVHRIRRNAIKTTPSPAAHSFLEDPVSSAEPTSLLPSAPPPPPIEIASIDNGRGYIDSIQKLSQPTQTAMLDWLANIVRAYQG